MLPTPSSKSFALIVAFTLVMWCVADSVARSQNKAGRKDDGAKSQQPTDAAGRSHDRDKADRPNAPARSGERRFGRHRPSSSDSFFKGNSKPFPEPFDTEEKALAEGVRMFKLMQGPEMTKRLDEALKSHPEKVHGIVKRAWPRLSVLFDNEKRDPKMFNLRIAEQRDSMRVRYLFYKLKDASEKKDTVAVSKYQNELRDVFARRFDTRMAIRQHELEALERRIKSMRDEMAKMKSGRQQYIDQMIERGSRWSSAPGSRRPGRPDKPKQD